MIVYDDRPKYASPQEYVSAVGDALAAGLVPWQPATRDELIAVLDAFPDQAWRFRPGPSVMRCLGLPADYGRDPEPLDDREKDRLIATLLRDDDLRLALRTALDMEVQS